MFGLFLSFFLFFLKSSLDSMMDEMVLSSIVLAGKSREDVLPHEPGFGGLSLVLRQETDISIEGHNHLHKGIHSVVQVLVVAFPAQSEHSDLLCLPVLLHSLDKDNKFIISHFANTILAIFLALLFCFYFLQLEVRPELVEANRPVGCDLS